MSDAHSDLIRLDTLDALLEHGHGLFGWCQDCAATYRPELLPEIPRLGSFAIDLAALIAERGAGSPSVRMAPPPCPRCGSRRTSVRITAPSKA
jgi:hypothetical protein